MKRHAGIVALSRDHHFGLLFCWKIRQGINKAVAAERIQAYIKYFWQHHLLRHFEEEEIMLFAGLQDALVDRAVSEHENIRKIISTISAAESAQPEQFRLLADTLDIHIRFEERILFPHLENSLPEDKLTELGIRLQELHAENEKDDYSDEFWV